MKPKLGILKFIVFLVVIELCVGGIESRRRSRKAGNLEEWQKRYLEKIQLAAKEGGMEPEQWKQIKEYDKNLCYERECLSSALEVMEATNFTADPCVNWLQFVCERRVSGPDNINQVERLMRTVETRTKKLLLDTDADEVGQNFLLKQAQAYYYQCKNKDLHDSQDVKDIIDYLRSAYGKWPMITNSDPGPNFDWFRMLADLNRIERVGFKPILLNVKVSSNSPAIQLEVGQISIPNTGEEIIQMMKRIQKSSGRRSPVRVEQLKGMFEFMNSASYKVLGSTSWQTLTIKQLQEKTDAYFEENSLSNLKIDWLEFFQIVMKGSDIEVTDSSPPVILPFEHVMGIMGTVNDYYFSDKDIQSVSNALNFQLVTLLLQESTTMLDDLNSFKCLEQTGSREEICYARTTEIFGYSLGKSYLSLYFDDEHDTPAIQDLMTKIQDGYVILIDGIEWMQDSTKEYLKDKVRSMKTYVAEPDWTKDPGKLHEFYETLTASDDRDSSFPLNYLNVTSWEVAKRRSWAIKLASLTSIKDFSFYDMEWSRYLGNVQAQFHKGINEARIEGGIVQSPVFGVNRPGFMNFGGLGMVLAHEVGHSYDTQGRTFNKDGQSGEWWDAESVKKYYEWVESIAQDYGSAVHQTSETSAETIDPYKTVNEDISDVLGIHISFLSYKEYLKELKNEGKTEKILPGLKNFTPQKLFYMKYANMWCDRKDVQDHFNDLLGSHSSGNTRATVPLKRSAEFAKTFSCKMPSRS